MTSAAIKGFQELVRVVDATLYEVDPNNTITGQGTLRLIIEFINREGVRKAVGEEFCSMVQQTVSGAKNANVREHVKKILMYPDITYPPWEIIDAGSFGLKQANTSLEELTGFTKIEIVDNKVYAMSIEDYKTTLFQRHSDIIGKFCCEQGLQVTPNTESQHITIVNSNIVQDCGLEAVTKFVESNTRLMNIKFGRLKTTVSNDWQLFSRCFVVEIQSSDLSNFVDKFNEHFANSLKKPLRISLHLTIAVTPRSLGLFH